MLGLGISVLGQRKEDFHRPVKLNFIVGTQANIEVFLRGEAFVVVIEFIIHKAFQFGHFEPLVSQIIIIGVGVELEDMPQQMLGSGVTLFGNWFDHDFGLAEIPLIEFIQVQIEIAFMIGFPKNDI